MCVIYTHTCNHHSSIISSCFSISPLCLFSQSKPPDDSIKILVRLFGATAQNPAMGPQISQSKSQSPYHSLMVHSFWPHLYYFPSCSHHSYSPLWSSLNKQATIPPSGLYTSLPGEGHFFSGFWFNRKLNFGKSWLWAVALSFYWK